MRCVGRTDDMLIVRGVNVFPSAVREVVSAFAPGRERPCPASGRRPPGVKQEPPLPVSVELGARGATTIRCSRKQSVKGSAPCSWSRREVELVPWGSLQRSEYKSKLVER